jgi:hypothetical protein
MKYLQYVKFNICGPAETDFVMEALIILGVFIFSA